LENLEPVEHEVEED